MDMFTRQDKDRLKRIRKISAEAKQELQSFTNTNPSVEPHSGRIKKAIQKFDRIFDLADIVLND